MQGLRQTDLDSGGSHSAGLPADGTPDLRCRKCIYTGVPADHPLYR